MSVNTKDASRSGTRPARQSSLARSARGTAATHSVAAVVAGILGGISILAVPGPAHAQAPTPPAQQQSSTLLAPSNTSRLQEVLVTATPIHVTQLDASYNIVSVTRHQIAMTDPSSVAEIYKMSPGVWPESSGGETGANIDVAGFPDGGGDSPFFTTMIEGTPLYGAPYLSFMDSSSLIRMDDTVKSIQIVQGGPSAIFGPGQPGATANFILRTGHRRQKGSVALTYGFQGKERIDAFDSGMITHGWYYSIGGFYRTSDGVRNPQYPANQGGQLTATLKHTFAHGSLLFWARTLHDHNLWVADMPYTVKNGTVSTYPGFNQLNSTYDSDQLENFQVPDPACKCFENDNISDGRGADLSYFGSDFNDRLGNGWSISNHFIFDGGRVPTHALVNSGNPTTLSSFLSGLTLPSVLTPADIMATFPNGNVVNPNQSVIEQQVWYVQKKITNVIDEFRVNKQFGDGNTLTMGVYAAHYTDNDNWSLSANALMTNQPNAAPIILSATAGGNLYQVSSPQGVVNANGGYYILEKGSATNVAGYLADTWKIHHWLLQAGVRLEHINLSQETTNTSPVQMGTPYDLWDNSVDLPNGTWSHGYENNTMPTYSVGVNYQFNNHMSAYVRVNNGVLFENFDDVRCNNGGCPSKVPLQTVQNQEVGFKVANRWTYINASIYHKTFKGLAYTPENADGVPIGPASTFGSTSVGVNLVGSVNPFADSHIQVLRSFRIAVNGNWENAYYQNFRGCFLYENINNQEECGTIDGKQLARLPKYQVRITPSDMQSFSWGILEEQVTYEKIGIRYQDDTGLTPLPSYYDLAAGIDAMVGSHWQFRLLGSNLTNQIGLTEGNARFGGNTVQQNVGMGRSIFGREVNITAQYRW